MNHSPDGLSIPMSIGTINRNFCKLQRFKRKSKRKIRKRRKKCKKIPFFLIWEVKNQIYALY